MSREDFKSLIVTDPDVVDEGIDVSGLRTTTDTSPFLLGNIPDYSGIQYSTLAPTKYTDLMRLYSQGLPTIDTSQPTTPAPPSGGGGGNETTNFDPVSTPIDTGGNTDFEQNLIDEGIGLQIEPGDPVVAPGEMPITQEEMDAFNQIPVNTDYTPPTSDPFLTSGAAGGARLPQAPEGGSPGILNPATYANTGDPDLLNLAGGEAGGADGVGIIDDTPGMLGDTGGSMDQMSGIQQPQTDSILAGEAMGRVNTGLEDDFLNLIGQEDAEIEDIPVELPATNIDTQVVSDPSAVNTILGPDGITYDAVTGQPIYEDLDAQAAAIDVVTEQDLADNTSLLQRLGLPADFNLKKAALEAGLNLVAGIPISLIARGLGAVLPDRNPRQTELDKFYTTGEGAQYLDPSSPNYIPGMENYNIVSGNPLDPNYGLQNAYQKRLETINKTLGKMTLEEYQNTDLVQRKKDIEEAMAKEKAMLDQLQYGDPEKIAAGIQTADDDSGSEMLDTATGVNPFATDEFDEGMDFSTTPETIGTYEKAQKEFDDRYETIDTPGGTITIDKTTGMEANFDTTPDLEFENIYEDADRFEEPPPMTIADDRINKMTDDVALDIFDTTPQDTTPSEPPSPPTGTDRPGGDDRDDSPAPSTPVSTAGQAGPPSQRSGSSAPRGGGADAASSDFGKEDVGTSPTGISGPPGRGGSSGGPPSQGGGGGGGGSSNGGSPCVIATHAVNSGAFTKDTKREAVRWCVKNLHRTWWGEAVRRGYRYYGQKAIEEGKAKNHYQEFKDYVAFGTGKRRTLKTGWTFVYRTVQFFLKGLTL